MDTSLFETSVFWVEGQVNQHMATGEVPRRHGTGAAVIVPYQVFETADRIHVHRLGKRLCVIDPKKHTMSDAVAYMTGAKVPDDVIKAMVVKAGD